MPEKPKPRRRRPMPTVSAPYRCVSCARVIPEHALRCRFCGVEQHSPEAA